MPLAPRKQQPQTPDRWVIPRPRVRRRIVDLVDRFGVVWVLASAGSGKTTAVADALESLGRATAWVSLDDTDVAPGRLLLQIEEALGGALPDLTPVVAQALAAKVPHIEAAAYLAEALGKREVVLVLDEVERLAEAESARVVLSALVRALDPAARIVLISRRDMSLHLGGARAVGGVGYVAERDLAFTVPEVERVLKELDRSDSAAEVVVDATGGWVAGVLFEAWRSPDHPHGAGGEADALGGYLSSEIMQQLTEEQRWFLIATSVLREVNVTAAVQLGHPDAARIMATLHARHIPVWFSPDANEMRCHPCFREFLRHRLDEHAGVDVRAVHVAHGRLLIDLDRVADAVDAFLAGGDLDAGASAAEIAIPEVLRRGDLAVAARWLRAFRGDAVERSEVLTRARLAVALEREAWTQGAAIADRLLEMMWTRSGGTAVLEPGLAGTIGTCYLHVGRFADAAAVVERARPGPARDTWRFALGLDCTDRPEHYRDRPPDRGETVDGLLHRLDYMHGRFGKLLQARPAPWAASRSSRVAALSAVGRFSEALALLDEWPAIDQSPAMTRIYVELMVDLGRTEEARTAIERGREVALRSSPYCAILHDLLEVMFALRVDRDVPAARRSLERVEEDPTAYRRTRVVDQVGLWSGLAALMDDDAAEAADHLRRVVRTMSEWDRQLLMPAVAVYLAEAEWRLGNEHAADVAADRGLAAAAVQGSNHLLLQALREFPAVLSRRLDAEAEPDSPWHGLGRALLADRPRTGVPAAPATHLHEFGPSAILHGGRRVDPRLSRSFEILAHLAAHGGSSPKRTLLVDLFEHADDKTRAYLRQALKRLRDALPDERAFSADGPDVTWTGGALTSDSVLFEETVGEARRLQGRERLEANLGALAASERGEYFPGSTSWWIAERREDLRRTATDVRLDAAEIAFELGEFERAQAQADLVLREDPYRESAWRLSMRIASSMGDDDRVIQLYRRCQQSLADLPTEPAASTQRLLTQLRR